MIKKPYSYYFLLLGITVSLIIIYFIIRPFFDPLILAAVFAFIFHPLYKKLLPVFGEKKSVASFFTTMIVMILIMLPLVLLGTQILKEASQTYQFLVGEKGTVSTGSVNGLITQIRTALRIPADFEINLNQYARQGLELLIANLGAIFSSFAKILLNAFVFVIALYFLLKDGGKLKDYLVALSPLADKDDELVILRLKSSVAAVVKGNLMIGVVQGFLVGIGFTIFGVPNAALWGVIAAVASLIPGFGTSLITVPTIIFLFLTGRVINAVGLLLWAATAVGLIDNLLGPKLIGHGLKIHPLAIFLSVLGGLAFFGPLGFLLGPLTISICLALIDIYLSFRGRTGSVGV